MANELYIDIIIQHGLFPSLSLSTETRNGYILAIKTDCGLRRTTRDSATSVS